MFPTLDTPGVIYLVHLDAPLGNPQNARAMAQHYVGAAELHRFHARIAEHRSGHGSKLLAAAVARGIGFAVARTWEAPFAFEKVLKQRYKNARELCPVCSGAAALRRGLYSPPNGQLVLELEDLPDVAIAARPDWYELQTLRRWRTARVLPASGHLDDDLL